jgi:exonuclease SbcD
LSRKNSQTLDGLREVLNVARKNKVDVVTIGGDLFESEEDAEALRPELRTKLFSGNEFQIIVIPGNHDKEAYRRNLDFGSDLRVLTKLPMDAVRQERVIIVGVPFLENPSEELVASLREATEEQFINILLLHCTLDISYAPADFGEEQEKEYFPIDSYTLSGLGFDFVLAGHFHADFIKKDLGEGCLFVYPGSPISLSWKHLGRRKVALLDTERRDIKEIPINSFYYDKLEIRITPGSETQRLEEISGWVETHANEPCELKISVAGHGEMSEKEFGELLKKGARCAQIEANTYRNVEDILRDPIYHDFKQLLQNREDLTEKKDDIDYRAIEVLSKLKAGRKIL